MKFNSSDKAALVDPSITLLRRVSMCALGLLMLSACSAIGGGKNPPDEFAITTKAPLVIPPDYSLTPPRPGEKRPQELSSSDRARKVLLGDESAAPPSMGEQVLLRKAGALAANQNIRQILASENGGRAKKDGGLANQLMFWEFLSDGSVDDSKAPLKVKNAEDWFASRKKAIRDVTGDKGTVEIDNTDALVLPGVF